MLYTRNGDMGRSGLYGSSARLTKSAPVYEALGTLDELNALLGYCRARSLQEPERSGRIASAILSAQECLFVIQAEVAGCAKSIMPLHIRELERMIDEFETDIIEPHSFVIPGSTELSGLLDLARAVCRRAERATVAIASRHAVSLHSRVYMNRLSSFLYALARYAATSARSVESAPHYS